VNVALKPRATHDTSESYVHEALSRCDVVDVHEVRSIARTAVPSGQRYDLSNCNNNNMTDLTRFELRLYLDDLKCLLCCHHIARYRVYNACYNATYSTQNTTRKSIRCFTCCILLIYLECLKAAIHVYVC